MKPPAVRWSPGIRAKVLLLSVLFLAIPWLGYVYIGEMEKFLRQGQERTLTGTARAVATALHDRPSLFDLKTAIRRSLDETRDLFARNLLHPIQLDGQGGDWRENGAELRDYGAKHRIGGTADPDATSLAFRHAVGRYGRFLYALFEVTDDRVVYRAGRGAPLDSGDHLQVGVETPEGGFVRFLVSPTGPGLVSAFAVSEEADGAVTQRPETRVQGVWVERAGGYTLELRIPLELVGPRLGFAIGDVDDAEARSVATVVGTSGTRTLDELGSVVVPSSEIGQVIQGLARTTSRIWVVDRHQRVLAAVGTLSRRGTERLGAPVAEEDRSLRAWLNRGYEALLRPLYTRVLREPREDFRDDLANAARLEGREVTDAVAGNPSARWRLTPDSRAVVLSAAHPVWLGDRIMGAVVVEETTNGILELRNQAMERGFTILIAAFLVGSLTLFLFASRLSTRVRRLRDDAEAAIDEEGRVRGKIPPSRAGDEIGDLSRSFAQTIERLAEYTTYLEKMASRLSHELRTPIAVVRSSLDNLRLQPMPDEARVYMARAQEGLDRLSGVLTAMSEATRLEHILQHAEKETFDLVEVVSGCVAGYRLAWPQQPFELDVPALPLHMDGAPDLLAQLLDKLADNAREFSEPGHPVRVSLAREGSRAKLVVSNDGPPLPAQMQGQLFESLVSIRPHKGDATPHLGLGLYVVKLITAFHAGDVAARNRADGKGVEVVVSVPVAG